ncbi:unnamed protein product [Brachionus calyciflorus]|uniref:ubiquitinyl hydrolase 1 n=1 Tax=Brachionus calyciflorus TaxID=104777 RepID=A0A813M1N1_9BILA|nr:unnamed protein product [Brachionus calyciflorus]
MTLDTSTQASKSSPQQINVVKKSRNEVIRTIQEITKVDEATINQAIEACQDSEGRYSMDTVLNILMDEKFSNEQKNRDSKSENERYTRQYGQSPSSNEDSTKFVSPSSKRAFSNTNDRINSFGPINNIDEDDDDDYDQISNYTSTRLTSDQTKSKSLESEILREDNKPCGLRNVGNTCWFNSIIQSLFHLPGFRHIILSFKSDDIDLARLDDKQKNMLLFVAELRKLFALMLRSKRKIINPNPTLKCLKNCSKYDSELFNQEDVSEFMTILVNIIEESFEIWNNLKLDQQEEKKQAEEENLVSKLNENLNLIDDEQLKKANLKKSKNNPIVNLLDGEIIVMRKSLEDNKDSAITDIFREVNIQMLNSRNLHAGLELEWGETLIDKQIPIQTPLNSLVPQLDSDNKLSLETSVNLTHFQQESWVKTLPRVLFICLNRYKFSHTTLSSSKILEPFEFYEHIYLDRYLDINRKIVKQKRKELKVLKDELKNLEDKLNSIKEYKYNNDNSFALDEALKCVINFIKTDYSNDEVFENIKPVNNINNVNISNMHHKNDFDQIKMVENCLNNWLNRTQRKINELNECINKIKNKIDTAFDEESLKKYRYNIHSVCIHEGTSTSGHFWTYIWNPKQQKWFKYNDTEVSETTWDDVYANSIGGSSQTNSNQLNDLNHSKTSDSTPSKLSNENDLNKFKIKSNDRIPSAYFLIYTKADDSSLHEETNELSQDIQEFLKYDLASIQTKMNKLKYKKILEDSNEILKKTNDLVNQNKLFNEGNNQTCMEHAKAFHDSTLEALSASYDKITVSTNATGIYDHTAAEEALKFAVEYELKKYTQTKEKIEEKLPEVDLRINHILIYANANFISNEIKQIALLDLFRMQIFQDNDIRLKILQTLAQIKFNEYVLKSSTKATSTTTSAPTISIMKHYENFLNDYRDYRSIIAAFINAVNFMDSNRFEDATPFFCVACEYNERIISSLHLKMKGMHHEYLLANRRKCLKLWNLSTIRKFTFKNLRSIETNSFDQSGAQLQQLNQQELNSLIETMINKFLPCFFRLLNSTNEDKAMVEEIRQDWLNILDSNLPGIQLFHDYMGKLFEEPTTNHYHSLNVNKTNLMSRYQEVVEIVKRI